MAPSSDPDPPDDPDSGGDSDEPAESDDGVSFGVDDGIETPDSTPDEPGPATDGSGTTTEDPWPRVDDGGSPPEDPDSSGSFSDDPLGWLGPRVLAVVTGYGLAVLAFAIGAVLTFLSALVLFSVGVGTLGVTLSGFVFLQGIAFPAVAFGYLGLRWGATRVLDREWSGGFVRLRVPGLKDVLWTVGGYVGMIVLVVVSLFLVSLLNAPTAQRSDQAIFQNPEALLLMIPISFLLIGPGEELLFRGIIQDRLRESFSVPAAILLTSGAFAPLHIFALTGGVQALLTTIGLLFVPSLVFGITYEMTENLTVPIVIHGAYNATIFAIAYISLTI